MSNLHGTVNWNSWRNFLRKICTIFKSFRHLTEIFLIFSQKNIRSVVKTELYESSATFSRKTLLKKNKCFNFFELARIIGLWAEGIQQDAKTTFYVIRETFWQKLFEKMLFLLNCFLPWAQNSGPSGRNFWQRSQNRILPVQNNNLKTLFSETFLNFKVIFWPLSRKFRDF